MARPNRALIDALRQTARRLEDDRSVHRWSHFGLCNCGHLAQTVTQQSAAEIQDTLFVLPGDWGEKAYDACATTGLPMDHLFEQMFALGMDREDFGHLERLSDPAVRARVPGPLAHTRRRDAVTYLRAWADLLEAQLPTPLPVVASAPTALEETAGDDGPPADDAAERAA